MGPTDFFYKGPVIIIVQTHGSIDH